MARNRTASESKLAALNAEILRKEAAFDVLLEDSLVKAFQLGARWERRRQQRSGALSVREAADISPAGGGRERGGRESGGTPPPPVGSGKPRHGERIELGCDFISLPPCEESEHDTVPMEHALQVAVRFIDACRERGCDLKAMSVEGCHSPEIRAEFSQFSGTELTLLEDAKSTADESEARRD